MNKQEINLKTNCQSMMQYHLLPDTDRRIKILKRAYNWNSIPFTNQIHHYDEFLLQATIKSNHFLVGLIEKCHVDDPPTPMPFLPFQNNKRCIYYEFHLENSGANQYLSHIQYSNQHVVKLKILKEEMSIKIDQQTKKSSDLRQFFNINTGLKLIPYILLFGKGDMITFTQPYFYFIRY